jgi:hypothetical protein
MEIISYFWNGRILNHHLNGGVWGEKTLQQYFSLLISLTAWHSQQEKMNDAEAIFR